MAEEQEISAAPLTHILAQAILGTHPELGLQPGGDHKVAMTVSESEKYVVIVKRAPEASVIERPRLIVVGNSNEETLA